MAYADYKFYIEKYYGDTVPESDFSKYAERASDRIDAITFDRLVNGFPEEERAVTKVKKAVCAVAEALYQIDQIKKASIESVGTVTREDGTVVSKAVSSISSGSESISYATGISTTGIEDYALAASNEEEKLKLLRNKAIPYLMNVNDRNGINLLSARI